jgi:hypothetical protein
LTIEIKVPVLVMRSSGHVNLKKNDADIGELFKNDNGHYYHKALNYHIDYWQSRQSGRTL